MTNSQDEITRVLRICEETLTILANQNRLSAEALGAFVQLSARVRQEMERRCSPDRRETPRAGGDRRAGVAADERRATHRPTTRAEVEEKK